MAEDKRSTAPASQARRVARSVPTATGGVTLSEADIRQAARLDHLGDCQGATVTTFRFADRPGYQVVRCPTCGAMNQEERD